LIKLFFNEKPHSHYFRRDVNRTGRIRFYRNRKYDRNYLQRLTYYFIFITSLVFATRVGFVSALALGSPIKILGSSSSAPLRIHLPESKYSNMFRAENYRPHAITIGYDNRIIYKNRMVGLNELANYLDRDYPAIFPKKMMLIADKNVKMAMIYSVSEICRQKGIRNIIYIVRPFDPETIQMVVE
jgi:biopolymer transport protein ExbD